MFIVENIEHIIKPSGHSGDEGQFKKHKLSFAVYKSLNLKSNDPSVQLVKVFFYLKHSFPKERNFFF